MLLTKTKRKPEIDTDVSNYIPIEINLIEYDATIIFNDYIVQDDRKKKPRLVKADLINGKNIAEPLTQPQDESVSLQSNNDKKVKCLSHTMQM